MIEAVVLKLSPEMLTAIDAKRGLDFRMDEAWLDNVGMFGDKHKWTITANQAADWCESWFDPEDLEFILEKNSVLDVEYPGCCEDDLVKDFVNTILKIYRLTVSV